MNTHLIWLFCLVFLYSSSNARSSLEPFKDANGKYGFKNKSGEIVVQAKYQDAFAFSEGLAAVQLNEKWGFILAD